MMQGREEARLERKGSDKLYENKVNATPNGHMAIKKYFTLCQ